MFDSAEDSNSVQTECFEPFPEPHTIPSGWDLSGLFPELHTDLAADEDRGADGETA